MTFQKDPGQDETKHLHQFVDFAGKRVLEIGCGEGRLTWRYAEKPFLIVGIDPDKDSLRVATIDRPSDLVDRVHFSNASAEQLPFPGETFEITLLSWSL